MAVPPTSPTHRRSIFTRRTTSDHSSRNSDKADGDD